MFKTFEDLLKVSPPEIVEMIHELKKLRERPDFHPEESAFLHVKIVVERLIETGDIDLILAGLFHDIYKFRLSEINPKTGYPTAHGHDKEGANLSRKYWSWIAYLGADPDMVYSLCEQHMRIKSFDEMSSKKQEELMNMSCWEKLQIFTLADNMLLDWNYPIS